MGSTVKFNFYGFRLQSAISNATPQILEGFGKMLVEEIRASMAASSGLPGQPPRIVEGKLRDSIFSKVLPHPKGAQLYVGSKGCSYARVQELGYPPLHLPMRPYLRPALENFKYHVLRDMGEAFRMHLRHIVRVRPI